METKFRDFDYTQQQWDRFRAFHNVLHNGRFILFQTGELMTTRADWRPNTRRIYEDIGIAITNPTDNQFKFALPDGTPVPKAWLAQGGQDTYFADMRTNRAVALAWTRDKKRLTGEVEALPKHMQTAVAWMTSDKSEPHSNVKVEVSMPVKLSAEEKDWRNELKRICNVYVKMNTKMDGYYAYDYHSLPKDVVTAKTPTEYFTAMDDRARLNLVKNGYAPSRETHLYDYILATPK